MLFGMFSKVHVDQSGNLLDRGEQKFVYVPPAHKDGSEVAVKTPFSIQPLKDILPVSAFVFAENSSFGRPHLFW